MRIRTTGVVLATTLLLSGIVWIVARNYDRALDAAAEQRATRQRALARTIAVGLEMDLTARVAALRQLGAMPSVQQVDEIFLPVRLAQGVPDGDGYVTAEYLRGTPDGRTLSWRPGQTTLERGARMADDVWSWARTATTRDAARMFAHETAEDLPAHVDLVIPIFHTAPSPSIPQATGAYLGWLAARLDLASLADSFFDPMLAGMSDTALAIVSREGARLLRRRPVRVTRPPAETTGWVAPAAHWADLGRRRDGSRVLDTPAGRRIVAWATVEVGGLALVVQSDAPHEVAVAMVRSTFAQQLLPFALLSAAVVAFAWMYLRSERSEQRYRDLVEQAADGVFVLDPQGRIVEMNSAAGALLDIPPSKAVGRAFVECLEPAHAAAWDTAFSRLAPGHRAAHEWRFRRPGGCVPAEVSLSRNAARRVLAIARDTSRRHQLEEQLRQSQKVEAIGRLAGGIAHDFNNLLTAIIGYTDLIVERLGHDPEGLADAREIRKSADRAAKLTRQLLAYGRKQMLHPRVLDVNRVIHDVSALLRRLIGEHVELTFAPADGLWLVEADPNQLEQVVVNLALNARDAMPDGGHLSMATANVTIDEGGLWPSELHVGQYVELTVSDTGHGIDEATRPHLFEPFFTTRAVGQGTGLGLPMVHGILTQSGGGIAVESTPGEGATFRVYLPRSVKPLPAPVDVPAARSARRGSETVLLVEDDDGVRALAREALGRSGYRVIEAATPGDALARCDGVRIDVVVSDVTMPQMSGPELVTHLRRERPALPALLISGYPDAAPDGRGEWPAGLPLMTKPFTAEELTEAVGRLLDGRPQVASPDNASAP